jgi:hypothetical protein
VLTGDESGDQAQRERLRSISVACPHGHPHGYLERQVFLGPYERGEPEQPVHGDLPARCTESARRVATHAGAAHSSGTRHLPFPHGCDMLPGTKRCPGALVDSTFRYDSAHPASGRVGGPPPRESTG